MYTRKMHTSRARLPKKLTFEPGDYVLKSSRNLEIYGMCSACRYIYIYIEKSRQLYD